MRKKLYSVRARVRFCNYIWPQKSHYFTERNDFVIE